MKQSVVIIVQFCEVSDTPNDQLIFFFLFQFKFCQESTFSNEKKIRRKQKRRTSEKKHILRFAYINRIDIVLWRNEILCKRNDETENTHTPKITRSKEFGISAINTAISDSIAYIRLSPSINHFRINEYRAQYAQWLHHSCIKNSLFHDISKEIRLPTPKPSPQINTLCAVIQTLFYSFFLRNRSIKVSLDLSYSPAFRKCIKANICRPCTEMKQFQTHSR